MQTCSNKKIIFTIQRNLTALKQRTRKIILRTTAVLLFKKIRQEINHVKIIKKAVLLRNIVFLSSSLGKCTKDLYMFYFWVAQVAILSNINKNPLKIYSTSTSVHLRHSCRKTTTHNLWYLADSAKENITKQNMYDFFSYFFSFRKNRNLTIQPQPNPKSS